ncbi:hypothetical protein [Halodurantibacterium flavum]|uniref:Uncharacterized protein n=1 Tax=Halodurantibacterium flavum TaxID=1382802 RepID=A0ABW4S4V7_9RHOB
MGILIKNNLIQDCDTGISVRAISPPEMLIAGNRMERIRGTAIDLVFLTDRFPVLRNAAPDLLQEASRKVAAAPPEIREATLRSTRLGKWLSGQSFVDWAALAVAFSSLVS